MTKRWIPKNEPDKATVESISTAINVNKTLSGILVQRGIESFEIARKFFRPQYADLAKQ